MCTAPCLLQMYSLFTLMIASTSSLSCWKYVLHSPYVIDIQSIHFGLIHIFIIFTSLLLVILLICLFNSCVFISPILWTLLCLGIFLLFIHVIFFQVVFLMFSIFVRSLCTMHSFCCTFQS